MMKPGTRLLIRLAYPDGSKKAWGYDSPFYDDVSVLRKSIERDFEDIDENIEIRLFYYMYDGEISAKSTKELVRKTIKWIKETGDYNGK